MSFATERPAWRSAAAVFVLYLLVGYGSTLLAKGHSQSAPVWLGTAVLFAFFSIVYFVLFLTLPITRKRTFCPKEKSPVAVVNQ